MHKHKLIGIAIIVYTGLHPTQPQIQGTGSTSQYTQTSHSNISLGTHFTTHQNSVYANTHNTVHMTPNHSVHMTPKHSVYKHPQHSSHDTNTQCTQTSTTHFTICQNTVHTNTHNAVHTTPKHKHPQHTSQDTKTQFAQTPTTQFTLHIHKHPAHRCKLLAPAGWWRWFSSGHEDPASGCRCRQWSGDRWAPPDERDRWWGNFYLPLCVPQCPPVDYTTVTTDRSQYC